MARGLRPAPGTPLGVLIVLLGAAFAHGQTPPITVRAISGAWRTAPDRATPTAFDLHTSDRAMALSAARNEVLGFTLLVRSSGRGAGAVSVTARPLRGPAGPTPLTTELFRVYQAEVGPLPAWHVKGVPADRRRDTVHDVLVPLNAPVAGQPVDIVGDEPLPIWVDLMVPRHAEPGIHELMFDIGSGGRSAVQLTCRVTVHAFVLPDVAAPAALAPFSLQRLLGHHLMLNNEPYEPQRLLAGGPLYDEGRDLVFRTATLLLRHRLTPWPMDLYPVERRDAFGHLDIAWKDYDDLAAPLLDGTLYEGQPRSAWWPVPFDTTFPSHPDYDPLGSARYNRDARTYLEHCVAHFAERDWLPRAVVVLPHSEALTPAGGAAAAHYAELFRLASERLTIAALRPPQNMQSYGWTDYPYVDLHGRVDIWAPRAQFLDPRAYDEPPFRGQSRWMQIDVPPFSGSVDIAAPDCAVRVIPWQADRLGTPVILLPQVNDWGPPTHAADAMNPLRRRPTPLLLPGRAFGLHEPIATLRLKALRRGLQDVAYLQLCRSSGHRKMADLVSSGLCRVAGAHAYGDHFDDGQMDAWLPDPEWWDQAIAEMGKALHAIAANVDSADHPDRDVDSLQWRRFIEATQRVAVETLSAQVVRSTTAEFEVVLLLKVRNDTPEAVSGSVAFGELPPDWRPTGPFDIPALPARGERLAELRATAPSLAPDEQGKLRLPLVLNLAGTAPRHWTIPLAHALAQRLFNPITVDGHFEDWPVALGNTAGGFRSISGAATVGDGGVLALIGRDREALYLAVHCMTPNPPALPGTHRNRVVFDQGVPAEPEVLEILIDPLNERSNIPADLYHLAITPTAVTVAEHGIRRTPQVGRVDAWTAPIEVATRMISDRWVAEIRIPLSAFGPRADTRRTWGLNIARAQRLPRDYVNWAEALWNVHSPASLGNLSFAD